MTTHNDALEQLLAALAGGSEIPHEHVVVKLIEYVVTSNDPEIELAVVKARPIRSKRPTMSMRVLVAAVTPELLTKLGFEGETPEGKTATIPLAVILPEEGPVGLELGTEAEVGNIEFADEKPIPTGWPTKVVES